MARAKCHRVTHESGVFLSLIFSRLILVLFVLVLLGDEQKIGLGVFDSAHLHTRCGPVLPIICLRFPGKTGIFNV